MSEAGLTQPRARWPLVLAGGLLGCALLGVLLTKLCAERVIVRAIAARSGHPVHFPQGLTIQWGVHPVVEAPELIVDDPPWMPGGGTARVSGLRLELGWQFSGTVLRLVSLQAATAELHLQRDAQNRANWQTRPGVMGHGPPLPASVYLPRIGVELHDELRHLNFRGTASLDGRDPQERVRLSASGELNGRPARIEITGAPLAGARAGAPYEFALEEVSGQSRLSAHGQVARALDLHAVEADFELHGPSLDELFFLAGLALPATAAFRASGHFSRHDLNFDYTNLGLQAGHSDLAGALHIAAGAAHSPVTGTLRSDALWLADLTRPAPALARPGAGLASLSRRDWDVQYSASRLVLGRADAHGVKVRVQVRDGVLQLPVTGTLGGGAFSGALKLETQATPVRAVLEWSARDVDLGVLGTGGTAHLAGLLSSQGRLESHGSTVSALLASARGSAAAVLPAGSIGRAAAEASALELKALWDYLLHPARDTPIRCALLGLKVADGVGTFDPLLVDTADTQIRGTGTVRLADGALDLRIVGRPKHATLRLRSPVQINGTLAHPQPHLQTAPAMAQAGLAAGMGALTPPAALAAVLSPGHPGDADCNVLLHPGS